MTCSLEIDFHPAEGAVLRLIGLVERRGYDVTGVDLPRTTGSMLRRIRLDLEPRDAGRRIEVLDAQIRRLYGVTDVRRPAANAARAVRDVWEAAS